MKGRLASSASVPPVPDQESGRRCGEVGASPSLTGTRRRPHRSSHHQDALTSSGVSFSSSRLRPAAPPRERERGLGEVDDEGGLGHGGREDVREEAEMGGMGRGGAWGGSARRGRRPRGSLGVLLPRPRLARTRCTPRIPKTGENSHGSHDPTANEPHSSSSL